MRDIGKTKMRAAARRNTANGSFPCALLRRLLSQNDHAQKLAFIRQESIHAIILRDRTGYAIWLLAACRLSVQTFVPGILRNVWYQGADFASTKLVDCSEEMFCLPRRRQALPAAG